MRSAVDRCSITYSRCSVAPPGLGLMVERTPARPVTRPAYLPLPPVGGVDYRSGWLTTARPGDMACDVRISRRRQTLAGRVVFPVGPSGLLAPVEEIALASEEASRPSCRSK